LAMLMSYASKEDYMLGLLIYNLMLNHQIAS
jgi:hypothetical protein